ncbi:MAG: hypothetical protein ABR594_11965 [Pyrinomonadaceae bacterium]
MLVVFRRSGERRYSVEAQRSGLPDVVMNPAPGYDPLMPHDLMHMIVEAQLGLTRGIFGQLAAGGTAGTFHLATTSSEGSRETARASKRVATRGRKLLKEGRDDCAQSEQAAYICWQEWLSRSSSPDRRKLSASMAQQAKEVRQTASVNEVRALNRTKLDEICEHLDELSAYWSRLKVGESMALHWPDLSIA